MVPALVHLVEPPLEHDRVFLRRQRAQQLAAGAVEAVVDHAVRLDLGLQVLKAQRDGNRN